MTWEKAFDAVQLFHHHRAESADTPQVVSPQVHQHVVLCKLLFVREQLRLQRLILRVGLASLPRSRQREGVQHAVLQLYQRLRRRSATSTSVPLK